MAPLVVGLASSNIVDDVEHCLKAQTSPHLVEQMTGNRDFLEAVWYGRTITVPTDWDGLRPILRFEAVDHEATVWVNGTEVATVTAA